MRHTPYTAALARRNSTKARSRRLVIGHEPTIAQRVDLPDDRPERLGSVRAANWIAVPPKPVVTERRTAKVAGWERVIVGHDAALTAAKGPMVRADNHDKVNRALPYPIGEGKRVGRCTLPTHDGCSG